MRRALCFFASCCLVLAVLAFASRPALAWKVYANPSIQSTNTSPDGTYTEGYAMQDVANRFMSKLSARGFEARGSGWLSLGSACSDAVNWKANVFVAIHTNAGGGGWGSGHGTEGFYYQSSSGWHDDNDIRLADGCTHKVISKFSAFGRGYDRGTFADYPYMGWNMYVLANTPGMNSTLIEGLFHDNYDDVQVLKSASGKDAYAQGLYEGICDFYGWSYEAWNSAFNSQSYVPTMTAGTQQTAWVEYKNTGSTTWTNSGANPVRLGTQNPQDHASVFYTPGDWVNSYRPTNMDQASVGPNGIGRFTFIMTAPSTAGSYQEFYKLVSENQCWFGYGGVYFTVNVVAAKGTISGRVSNALNSAAVSGATVTLNTGASTTTNGTGNYSFANLDPGAFTVTASKSGFASNSGSAPVTAGNTTTANIALTPTDTQAPSVPTGLSARGLNGNQIGLDWSASTDNVGVSGYKIFRNGALVGTAGTATYTDSGLSPMTSYTYRVSAYDGVGNESAPSDPATAATLPGMTAVFTDGFGDLSNWVGDPSSAADLGADGGVNHGALPGSSSAKATAGAARYMYHAFATPFATGKYEGFFYDAGTNDNSRQGIHIKAYNSGGAPAYSLFLGCYYPSSSTIYYTGIYDGSAWTWTSTNQTRTVGWHKFAIELLPSTGSGDLKFSIDDSVKVTANRPAAANSYGISRIYVGHNYNVNMDGWYDDITFSSQAPASPTMGAATALSTDSVRWSFGDNSDNEFGFRLTDDGGSAIATAGQANLDHFDETGLAPNTGYSRKVVAYNGSLDSWPSGAASRVTLSVPPSEANVTSDRITSAWYPTADFHFTAANGFGAGTVQYYRWVFDQNSTRTWTGNEPVWDNGQLTCTANTVGQMWYLHLQGFNAEDVPNGTLDLGPYLYGSPLNISGVDASGITQTAAQITWSTDVPASSQVDYGLTNGYGSSSPVDSNPVTSHVVSLSGLTQNTTYHFRVRSTEAGGSTGISTDYTFKTLADTTPPGPPTNISVSAAGVGGQVNLSWTNPTDSDFAHVHIYRSTASGTLGGLVYDNLTGTSKLDTGLTDGTTCYYTLKAIDTAGNESTNADQYAATPMNPLTGPAFLNAVGGASSISLNWGAVSGATSYSVYRATASGGEGSTPLASGITGTSYADNSVTAGTAYYYLVRGVLGTAGPASPEASATPGTGLVTVFTDGFVDFNNWAGDPSSAANLSLDSGKNHATFAGANGAKAPTGASRFMYHAFAAPFATGKYEAWFYDAGTSDASRQGIHVRALNTGGTAAYSFYLGTYSSAPGSYATYTAGVYNGSAWTWTGMIQTRTIGWHKFTIEVLPYTGANDVTFWIDGTLKATMSRPANSDSYGINRIYVGHNYNVNMDGWYDDAAFYAQAPAAPTMAAPVSLATDKIRWSWADNSNNEFGFRLQSGAGASVADLGKNIASYDETGLAANTLYARRVKAYNGTLESGFTAAQSCTLSVPPSAANVTCDRATGVWYPTPTFTFTAVGGFGVGKVQYYRFAFNQSASYTFTGAEPIWDAGTLTRTATVAGGNWYLHLQGYNAVNVANGTLDLGPYSYDGGAPIISNVAATGITGTGATIGWTTNEAATSQVEYGLSTDYGASVPVDTTGVMTHSMTLSGLSGGRSYHYRVRSTDAAGNEAVSGDFSFDTANVRFTSPAGFVQPGWNLISLPAVPDNPDPVSVLAGIDVPNVSLQYWVNDVDGGGYQLYGETFGWTGPLKVGTPYWFIETESAKTLDFAGTENTGDWVISLPARSSAPYWIMVGQPFNHATLCSAIKFASRPGNPLPIPWADAYTKTVVESTAQGYEPSNHSFFTVGPSQFVVERDRLQPWYGYWFMIRTADPVTITIPAAPAP